nr:hypothetical protein [uncultured Peptostreptococcus sp.]
MIKTELEKLKTNVDSILNSMENLKAKTDSDDQTLSGLAFHLPSVIKNSKTRLEMEERGVDIHIAISKSSESESESSVISRLSTLANNLIPYLTCVIPPVTTIIRTHDNWNNSFKKHYIPKDVSHNILIKLLTTKFEKDMNIFNLPVLRVPDDFFVKIENARKVIEIRSGNVTVSDTVTPNSEMADNTLYIATMGATRGICCKSLIYDKVKMFVKCDDNTPEVILGKLGEFID